MAISACEESDGKEEYGRDCCTTSCGKSCLQNPSLNPPPLCTQQQRTPEEERSFAALSQVKGEVGDGDGRHADDDDDDDDAVIDPPPLSPSHPQAKSSAPIETQENSSSAERDCHSAECSSPPDQTDMAAPSPSSSELRHQLLGDSHPEPLLSRHMQRERRTICAAPLDPNAREFVPPSFPPSSHFYQSQTQSLHSCVFPQANMAHLHQQMGALNLEMGSSNAIAYESVQPLHETSSTFNSAHSTPMEMGYHIPSIADVGYNQDLGAYERTGYGIYQAAPQMGYPATAQGGLLIPPWHNASLPHIPAAMESAPAPLAPLPIAPAPPLARPSMYPSAVSMEAHLLHPQKQFSAYHGFGNPKEHVSRTLLISGIPSHISEAQLREELQWWGAIRGIQADTHPLGLQVMVQFFDLRAARQALRDMQNFYIAHQNQQLHTTAMNPTHKHHADEGLTHHGRKGLLCGSVVLAQYIGSWGMAVPDAHNQGTLVLFNVGADVNMQDVRKIFEAYGYVREVREAPAKRQHKFVEFYDVRAAAAAWSALNGKEICGKCVKIEFSRQGGAVARRHKTQQGTTHQEITPAASNQLSQHGHTVDPCSWHGNAAMYGLSLYTTGLQLSQGWDRWPSHEGVPGQFPVNVCMAGSPHIPICAEATSGHHGDGNGVIGENVVTASGGRRMQSESGRVAGTQPHCVARERYSGISRLSKGLSHYQFDEDEMHTNPSNPKTTLMIQNIPNKYSQKMLLTMLDQHCSQFNSNLSDPEAAYDFMYLPIDFKNKCNLGYAFVNFTTPQATHGFYKAFHGKAWEEFNSRKICGVAYARLQGRPALEEHFKNSRFACDTEEYLPVLFAPPRNGNNQSQPRVAVGQQGLVRGVRSGNSGHSYFSNDPCNQYEKIVSDSSSSSTGACEAHDHPEAKDAQASHASDALELAPPEMG